MTTAEDLARVYSTMTRQRWAERLTREQLQTAVAVLAKDADEKRLLALSSVLTELVRAQCAEELNAETVAELRGEVARAHRRLGGLP